MMPEAVTGGSKAEVCSVTLHNANEKRLPIKEYPGYNAVTFGTPDNFSYMAGTLRTFMDDWYLTGTSRATPVNPTLCSTATAEETRRKSPSSSSTGWGPRWDKTSTHVVHRPKTVLDQCRALGSELAKKA